MQIDIIYFMLATCACMDMNCTNDVKRYYNGVPDGVGECIMVLHNERIAK